MKKYRGSIHISDVHDGQNGRDAVSLIITPATITVDTKADGTVDESCLKDAKATVRAYAGGKPLKLTITSVEKSAGIDAEAGYADNFRTVAGVKIKAIAADTTGYAMASGSVTVGLSVYVDGAEQHLTAVIGVVTTLHKVTAEIAKDNVSVTQKVTELTKTVNGNQTDTETALSTLNGAIAGKVSRTDYDADKRAQSQRETEIRQSVEYITLAVKNRGNILRGTGFRNQRTLPELTGNAVWSDKAEDLYGSHGVIHVPMSMEAAQRNAGMRYLIPRSAVQNGQSYTLSVAVLVKDTADLSNISSEQYYVKADRQTRIGGMIKYETWEAQAFSAGSWRRVAVTFAPDFTKAAGGKYLELRFALYGKGEAWFAEPQFETGTVATPWAPNVNDADENLQDTALEIKNRKIVATTDNFAIRNNKGEETAAVTEDGKFNTTLVDAKKVVTDGVKAQTIDAGNATFKNLNVTGDSRFSGTITTEDGSIAGWKLGRGYIGRGNLGNGLYLTDHMLLFNDEDFKRQAFIGSNVADPTTGQGAMLFLKDETDKFVRRTGIFVDIRPAANPLKKNIAINTLSGSFSGFRRTLRVTMDDITLDKADSAILVTGQSTVHLTLPAASENGEEFVIYTSSFPTIVFETTDGASVNKIYEDDLRGPRHIYHAVFAREYNTWYIF